MQKRAADVGVGPLNPHMSSRAEEADLGLRSFRSRIKTDEGTICQKGSTEGGTGRESPNSPTVRFTSAYNVGTRPETAGNQGCPGNVTRRPALCTEVGMSLPWHFRRGWKKALQYQIPASF